MSNDKNIISLNKEKVFTKEGELMDRLSILIDEYAGELSMVAVIGILELKKQCVMSDSDE